MSVGCAKTKDDFRQLNRDKDIEFDGGSKIKFSDISKDDVQDLAKLSKVWGVVKYYHPKAISGDINMDYELFRIMPLILEENADVNALLNDWIKSLGKVEETPKQDIEMKESLIQLEALTQWTWDNEYLGEDLSSQLSNLLETNITERENGYVSFNDGDVYASMENERSYDSMNPEDTGYRLLSLFRYWNIIEYYYPYKDIIGEDWDKVLEEFIPKFVDGTDYQSYLLAIGELTTKIHDTHSSVNDEDGNDISSYFGTRWLPASYIQIDGQIIINNAVELSDLKNGDIVLSIDNEPIDKIITDRKKYKSQSRDDIVIAPYLDIFRTLEQEVDVLVVRNNKELNLNVETSLSQVSGNIKSQTEKLENDKIYYINVGYLKDGEISEIMNNASDTEGLIVDMRNYPSSFIPYELADYLIPNEKEFVKAFAANQSLPGQFYYFDTLISGGSKDEMKDIYDGKLVILMDEHTLSQGEFTVMALKNTEDSVILGRDSAGTDGNVVTFTLPGNVTTTITGVGIFHPNGDPTQRIGIKPDIYMDPSIQGIRDGRDEYLEKAIEIIKES